MASPWEEKYPATVDAAPSFPDMQDQPGWSWSARWWLGWWIAVIGAVGLGFVGLAQNQPWGGGWLALGLLSGAITLVPWLTWLAEQRVRSALALATLSDQATLRRGWSRSGIFWIAAACLMPVVGITLGVLAQRNPQQRETINGLLALWMLVTITLALLFFAWLRRHLRLARALHASYLMNFRYTDLLAFTRKPPWRLLPLFERSKVQMARHVLEGHVGSMAVTVLEWADPEMAVRHGRTGLPLVIVADGIQLPAFELHPRRASLLGGGWTWLHLLHGPVGLVVLVLHWAAHHYSQSKGKDAREVELENPFFSRRYQLLSHEEQATQLLFTPYLCTHLLAEKADWLLQSNGDQLLLCNLRGSDDPHKYPQLVATSLQLAHLLHDTYAEAITLLEQERSLPMQSSLS